MTGVLVTVTDVGIATVQDGGRFGRADIGVPVSGAWHRPRYDLVSALMTGVSDGSMPTAELLAGVLRLNVQSATSVAVVGPARFEVNGRLAPLGTVIAAVPGDLVFVQGVSPGPVYVAVGGWQAPRLLGSASFDAFSGLGGGPIAANDEWRGRPDSLDRVGWFGREAGDAVGPIRAVSVTPELAREIAGWTWHVVSAARSGVRLRTAGWTAPSKTVASLPMLPGAVQVTPDGEAIVLGPDGGLTGGYPVAAVVATADLPRLSLLAPGAEVRFVPVGSAEATRLFTSRPRPLLAHPGALA